ncbi:MAG TPA: hypothetical protein VGP26_30570 [Actinophytocola sp.]|jgi:hypothetical protein|nr:hypothetical protein [Actinophytocola sp.]
MDRYLGIYRNDQLALGRAWCELARRTAHNNRGTDEGTAVEGVAQGIAQGIAEYVDTGASRPLAELSGRIVAGVRWSWGRDAVLVR